MTRAPRFVPIRTEQDVLAACQQREHLSLDFKLTLDLGSSSERKEAALRDVALDAAAFANALGGSVLYGVAERGASGGHIKGLSLDDLTSIAGEIERAIRDRTSPRPLFESHPITCAERHVLALNVHPFPGQPIAARVTSTGTEGWAFPIRVGPHKRYVPPEQIPMHIDPQSRTKAILASQITSGAKVAVTWRRPTNTSLDHPTVTWCEFHDVDVFSNRLGIDVPFENAFRAVNVPLEDVDAIWEAQPQQWHIRLCGYFDPSTNWSYVSNPSNATFSRPR
jgi:hypothetical protein